MGFSSPISPVCAIERRLTEDRVQIRRVYLCKTRSKAVDMRVSVYGIARKNRQQLTATYALKGMDDFHLVESDSRPGGFGKGIYNI